MQGLLRERSAGIPYRMTPMAIPSLPREPGIQRVKSQHNRRDRKEGVGWNYISSGSSIRKSSQRNQGQEENRGLARGKLSVPET